ncbi:Lipoprotein signal peptidase [Thioalkalivibrio nitratireducens DSM 14787]|uniref:Lipoprotein signal peptidase n=1 Tax=Thioalkalivibrio nitratireducens (strain DSM 14787 / UNIQEM 213 / ALEN2) TaxID=1255043 RepID=L0DSC2_THIND|nr:signal peptidase II [Thioalkalivibrio nitratireducens]AGA31882.1 Lipoprotein signal peptidase [Thioalkalivibrio nitratireducens DSM 14787]
MSPATALWPGLAVAATVFVLDQITKFWAERVLTLYAPIEVTGFFNLTLVYNPGAAFSFLSAAGGWQRWLLSGIALGVGVLIVVWLRRLPRQAWLMMASLGLILGGALGNLVDRLRLGMVVDFLDFHYAGLHWPAFNVADAAITVGAISLIIATCTEQCGPNRGENAS